MIAIVIFAIAADTATLIFADYFRLLFAAFHDTPPFRLLPALLLPIFSLSPATDIAFAIAAFSLRFRFHVSDTPPSSLAVFIVFRFRLRLSPPTPRLRLPPMSIIISYARRALPCDISLIAISPMLLPPISCQRLRWMLRPFTPLRRLRRRHAADVLPPPATLRRFRRHYYCQAYLATPLAADADFAFAAPFSPLMPPPLFYG